MKKKLLTLLISIALALTSTVTVFADNVFNITNNTPKSAEETNHGYITVDEKAAKDETVTITVNPATGYQLKSLTATPVAPTISTIADVLATVEGFPEDTAGGTYPVTPSGAWSNGNGGFAFIYDRGNSFILSKDTSYTYGFLTTTVTKKENCYTATISYGSLTFNMENGILTSFEFTADPSKPNAADYVGTYTPANIPSASLKPITPAKQTDGTYHFEMPAANVTVTAEFEEVPVTIADILPEDLLDSSNNKWINKNGYSEAYVSNGKLFFQEKNNPTSVINDLLIANTLTQSGDNYTITSGGRTFTFTMSSNTLISITVSDASDYLGGDYLPPTYVAKIGDTKKYETLEAAIAAAKNGDTIKLLKDIAYATNGTDLFNITKSITLDGDGYSISGYGDRSGNKTTLAINNGGSSTIDVTLKNLTINNVGAAGRPIETRGKIGTLTLDKVTVNATGGGNTQCLTVGGNQSTNADIIIKDSKLNAGSSGYPVITFNPVTMTITGSTFNGFCGIYFKGVDSSAGSCGSKVVANNSNFNAPNAHSYGSNDFGVFVLCIDDVEITLENCNINAECIGTANQTIVVDKQESSSPEKTQVKNKQYSITFKGEDSIIKGIIHNNSTSKAYGTIKLEDGSYYLNSSTTTERPNNDGFSLYKTNSNSLAVTISGGIFNINPSSNEIDNNNYVADGYKRIDNPDSTTNESYPHKVVPKVYVAQVGDMKYETIDEAIHAANNSMTLSAIIKILSNENVYIQNPLAFGEFFLVDDYSKVKFNQSKLPAGLNETYSISIGSVSNGQSVVGYKIALQEYCAKIVETGNLYATLQSAINAAENNQTVQPIKNINLSTGEAKITNKKITLDLAGYNVSGTGFDAIYVTTGGDLTIKGNGKIETSGSYGIYADKNGILSINDATIIGSKYAVGLFDTTSVTVNSGYLKGGYYAVVDNGSKSPYTTMNINGGTLEGTNGAGIYHPGGGPLT